ncbi:MAG: hypothetical protein EAZ92_01930 [Candidatus Kapaibacterium sp.]|nr:MAG: hypothetical protein EAZ92_01930 [Candidatus Kapabacteria bacterium]
MVYRQKPIEKTGFMVHKIQRKFDKVKFGTDCYERFIFGKNRKKILLFLLLQSSYSCALQLLWHIVNSMRDNTNALHLQK